MMKILIKNEAKQLWNSLRTQKTGHLVGYLIATIVLLFILGMLTQGAWTMSSSITEPVFAGILTYGYLLIVGMIILMGVPQVFKDMYSTTDLEHLFTLPIKTKYIFWMKYLKSFFGIPLFLAVFFMVPIITYGIATGVSGVFYPIAFLVMLSFMIIGLSIAYLFNLLLIQVVPASRANEFVTVMSFASGIIVYFIFMAPTFTNDLPITEIILSGLPLLPSWVPVTWGSTAMIEAANGSFAFGLPILLLLLLALASFLFSTSLVEKGFRTGWVRLSEGSGKKRKKRKQTRKSRVRHPVWAIGKKEWFAFKRDVREWMVLMPIGFFMIFGIFGILSGGGLSMFNEMRDFNELSWPIAQMILLFIYMLSTGSIAAHSIGREGSSLWVLKTLPLSGKHIILGKLWISWLLPFVLLTGVEVVIGFLLGWTFLQFITGIFLKALVTVGLSALGLLMGTIGGKYHATNPQARLHVGVSIILFVSSWIYTLIISLPFGYLMVPLAEVELPAGLDHGITGFFGVVWSIVLTLFSWKTNHPVVMAGVGFIVLALVSIGLTSLFIMISARRVDKGITIDMVGEKGVSSR